MAVKVEKSDVRNPKLGYFLKIELEYKFYKILSQSEVPGIPLIFSLKSRNNYNLLFMELLGSSLDELFIKNNKKFSLKTVLMLANSMYLFKFRISRL